MTPKPPDATRRQDVDAHIVERALRDDIYRQRLKQNPKAVLAEAIAELTGQEIEVPENVEVKVVEETPGTVYLVLPARLEGEAELSEEQLASAAGGGWGHSRLTFYIPTYAMSQTLTG
jgi:hypothetical protein